MNHLSEIAIYLFAALIAVPIFRRLGLGAVLGYLAAGMLIGPWCLGLVSEVDSVMQIAEIGVVFLLFVIGLELKPSRLWVMRQSIFLNGSLQVALAAIPLAALCAWYFQIDWRLAAFVGFALALSSTAFVLQTLAEKQQIGTQHGRSAFGILLFQDIAVIPALALMPLLASNPSETVDSSFGQQALQAIAVITVLIVGGRYLLRPIFRGIARWGNEDSFTVMALLVVLGAALLMAWADLSMGLGAFLAGVLLADSEYRHELEGNINPFKGLLLGLFFISVGMSADFGVMHDQALLIGLGTLLLLSIKATSLWLGSRLLGVDKVNSSQLALILAQGGEFAFVLFHTAQQSDILSHTLIDPLISMVILSMGLTPLLFLVSDRIGLWARVRSKEDQYDNIEPSEPPVIIAGFGRMGQIIARVLQMRGIAFTALEKDAAHVALVRRWGNKIYYGQSNNRETLRAAGAQHAKLLIITMDDDEKALRTIEVARNHFPHLKIYCRARDRMHALHLMDLKIDGIMRETWLSSLEMANQVLRALGDSEEKARYTTDVFRNADEDLLHRQLEHRHDLDKMVVSTQQLRAELTELFESDARISPLDKDKPKD
ncbi:MAG: monovalent cation:proton antiporter-2 (CPA2) family protein [Oceanococcus sp.]